MTNKVLVKNRNYEDYTENFMGSEVVIPAGGSIEMKRTRAIQFLRTMSKIDENTGKPKTKNLVIEKPSDYVDDASRKFVCAVCAEVFNDQKTLDQHMTVHANAKKVEPLEEGHVKCPFCGFVAKNRLSLSTHLRTCGK